MRHRSINRDRAVASGSSFFNGWRSTPGTTPLTSQLVLLISTTTTKVEIGSNAARLRLRSLTCSTGQPPSVRMDDEGATTSAAPPHSFSHATEQQRDELASSYVEHGGLPPRCTISAADWPVLGLPQLQPAAGQLASPWGKPEMF